MTYITNPKEMTDTRLNRYIQNLKSDCFSYGSNPSTPDSYMDFLADKLQEAYGELSNRNQKPLSKGESK